MKVGMTVLPKPDSEHYFSYRGWVKGETMTVVEVRQDDQEALLVTGKGLRGRVYCYSWRVYEVPILKDLKEFL